MKTFLTILFIVLAVSPVHADNKSWTATDTTLQLTFSTLLIMDWTQTLHIVRNKDKYYETNNMLGEYPSKRDVNRYFFTSLVGHAAVSYLLPKPYRTIWQSVYIIIEYDVIQKNRDLGIGISMHF